MVPVTAVCWVGLMIGAMITRARRDELPFAASNLLHLGLAAARQPHAIQLRSSRAEIWQELIAASVANPVSVRQCSGFFAQDVGR